MLSILENHPCAVYYLSRKEWDFIPEPDKTPHPLPYHFSLSAAETPVFSGAVAGNISSLWSFLHTRILSKNHCVLYSWWPLLIICRQPPRKDQAPLAVFLTFTSSLLARGMALWEVFSWAMFFWGGTGVYVLGWRRMSMKEIEEICKKYQKCAIHSRKQLAGRTCSRGSPHYKPCWSIHTGFLL